MPRACHAEFIDVRTEGGKTRVTLYGKCPKCGTGSGYLPVPPEYINHTQHPQGCSTQLVINHHCIAGVVSFIFVFEFKEIRRRLLVHRTKTVPQVEAVGPWLAHWTLRLQLVLQTTKFCLLIHRRAKISVHSVKSRL